MEAHTHIILSSHVHEIVNREQEAARLSAWQDRKKRIAAGAQQPTEHDLREMEAEKTQSSPLAPLVPLGPLFRLVGDPCKPLA